MTPLKALLAVAAIAAWIGAASAQEFPTRPITIVVPFPAGGISDQGTRLIAQKVSETLGQPIIVDNRGGAGGNIGAVAVKNAQPDGYTLYLASVGSHAINQALYTNLPFDPVKDFSPITLMFEFPHVLAVPLSSPAQSVQDLVKLAKSKPGKLAYASQGIGAGGHLLAEMFKARAGIEAVHVPYRGSAPALPDLIAGRVDFFFDGIPGAGPLASDGKVRALAMASAHRSGMLPDVPTMAEAGFPGIELTAWFGIVAPAGTPPAVIAKLNAAFTRALKDDNVVQKLAQSGVRAIPSTPAQFAAHIAAEADRLGKVVKLAGAHID